MRRLLIPVLIGSECFGDTMALLVAMQGRDILVEMAEPMPLLAVVTVHFIAEHCDGHVDELVARAEVKRSVAVNTAEGSLRAYGMRILDFDDRPPLDLPRRDGLH